MVKYAVLEKYLISLGFVDESVKNSHHAFRHSASGTLILFSLLTHDDDVRQEDLVSVRRHLVENGLIKSQEFTRLIKTGARSAR